MLLVLFCAGTRACIQTYCAYQFSIAAVQGAAGLLRGGLPTHRQAAVGGLQCGGALGSRGRWVVLHSVVQRCIRRWDQGAHGRRACACLV